MSKIVVVTGTDTEVGKTFVSAALARAFVERGYKTIAIKPVESGVGPEVSQDEDAQILAAATLQEEPTLALQRLKAPLAPPDAADLEKVKLEFGRWVGVIRGHARVNDVVLVEGAGGLLSPLTWKETSLSLAQKLDAKMVLVASDKLGSLNHTMLSMKVMENEGVPLAAVVFSAPLDSDRSTGRNASALARFTQFERIASVPGMKSWEFAAPLMGKVVEWVME